MTTDGEIRGCPVASGDRLALSLQSANLDEEVWGRTGRGRVRARPRRRAAPRSMVRRPDRLEVIL